MNIDTIDRDDLIRIRAIIMSLASVLSEVLTDGLPAAPKRGRSKQDWIDAMSAYEEWHECRYNSVRAAEEFLKETEGWT
jgi:hypothetical protein